ncbi:MAG TPA: hypothetical protein DD727_09365, partial [Clostridiales bacterium]|nr:hypothetical protein [Clostridiales bacterium]
MMQPATPPLQYQPWDTRHKRPFGAVPADTPVEIYVGVSRRLGTREIFLRYAVSGPDGTTQLVRLAMSWTKMEKGYDYYRCTVNISQPGSYPYDFLIRGEKEEVLFSNSASQMGYSGMLKASPVWEGASGEETIPAADSWRFTLYEKGFKTPNWARGGIMYQIFVDRFHFAAETRFLTFEGSPDFVGTRKKVLRADWGGIPAYRRLPGGDVENNDFFGGNLQGIIEKLDYLASLGVGCLYLNPIFDAASNHKY